VKLHFPWKVWRGEGGSNNIIPVTLVWFFVFCYFIMEARLVDGSVVDKIGPPFHALCGSTFCLKHLPRRQQSLHQLVGMSHLPPGTAGRNRQHAHCLFIPCFDFHYYISQEMHTLANSYWQKKKKKKERKK
jgi:hypothetical protein